MSVRSKLALLAVAAALLLGAAAPTLAGASALYELNREGFHIALVVKGNRLVHLRIRVRERCTGGTSPVRTFSARDLHRVVGTGQLFYVGGFSTEHGYEERRLSAHVSPGAVKGAFLDIEEEVGYYVCATGRPGHRALRFTARRVRRSPGSSLPAMRARS